MNGDVASWCIAILVLYLYEIYRIPCRVEPSEMVSESLGPAAGIALALFINFCSMKHAPCEAFLRRTTITLALLGPSQPRGHLRFRDDSRVAGECSFTKGQLYCPFLHSLTFTLRPHATRVAHVWMMIWCSRLFPCPHRVLLYQVCHSIGRHRAHVCIPVPWSGPSLRALGTISPRQHVRRPSFLLANIILVS